jgi:hypothetical protein
MLRLTDFAKSQELKEALITYVLLLEGPCNPIDLTERCNVFLERNGSAEVAFEIKDAIEFYTRVGIVEIRDGKLHAKPIKDTVTILQDHYMKCAMDDLNPKE